MLPPQHHLQHPKPTHHPSHTLAHAEAISIDNDHLAPIPPPKTPDTPTGTYTPLSKRLFNALVNKPTLSRTWEKKSYADQQRSAPLDGEMDIEQGQARGYRSPRSRPISFYASPAEIAAFRPLPMIETNGHVDHAHSAPVTPAAPTMG
ncbi:hypothetical protein CI109_106207 [Kwoniella shandongensis]|uniref:Uncharacterized protein n=1 Tax=Kwoniella shandongensis TaxID=1734106 RepID=A0AAJ8LR05_9TREE